MISQKRAGTWVHVTCFKNPPRGILKGAAASDKLPSLMQAARHRRLGRGAGFLTSSGICLGLRILSFDLEELVEAEDRWGDRSWGA